MGLLLNLLAFIAGIIIVLMLVYLASQLIHTQRTANDDLESVPLGPHREPSPQILDLLELDPLSPPITILKWGELDLPNNVRASSPDYLSNSAAISAAPHPITPTSSQTFNPRRVRRPHPDISDKALHSDLSSSPDIPYTSTPCMRISDLPSPPQDGLNTTPM